MRSYRLNGNGIENIKQASAGSVPQPGKGEIVVKMKAASLNYRDLLVLGGGYGKRKSGLVPLSDGAGEVVEAGEGVPEFKAGDRVALTFHVDWLAGRFNHRINAVGRGGGNIDGVLQEYVCVKAHEAVTLPSHLTFEEGATLPCAAVTAWTALKDNAELLPGDVVVVQGTGGVSVFALQFAKLFGARVVALSSTEKKLEWLRGLGADEAINYSKISDWDKAVLDITGGVGGDLVVEVGGGGTFGKSIAATRPGGRISVVGLLTGMPDPGSDFFARMVSIHPIRVGSREHFLEMNRAIDTHQVQPVVDSVFPFDEAVDAFRYFESRKHVGKVVINFNN